jgi:hypothetical protein
MTRIGKCGPRLDYFLSVRRSTHMPVFKTMMMRNFSYTCSFRNGMDPKCSKCPISLCQYRYGFHGLTSWCGARLCNGEPSGVSSGTDQTGTQSNNRVVDRMFIPILDPDSFTSRIQNQHKRRKIRLVVLHFLIHKFHKIDFVFPSPFSEYGREYMKEFVPAYAS